MTRHAECPHTCGHITGALICHGPMNAFSRNIPYGSSEAAHLEQVRTTKTYQRRLLKAGKVLEAWLAMRKVKKDWASDPAFADAVLVACIQFLYDKGEALWLARRLALAAQHWHLHLRYRLPRTWQALSAWQLERPLQSRKPMPFVMVMLEAIAWALQVPSHAKFMVPLAVLTMVGFHGCLRVGELCGLRAQDIDLPSSMLGSMYKVVIALRDPQNRAVMGRLQFITIEDVSTMKWLEWLIADMAPEQRLWQWKQSRFARWLSAVMLRLRLEHLHLTPAS